MKKNKIFDKTEIKHIIIATLVIGFIFSFNQFNLINWLRFSILGAGVILIHEIAHKIVARKKACESHFRLWEIKRYGFFRKSKFPKKILGKKIGGFFAGIFLPIITIFLSLGSIKLFLVGTSEAKEIEHKRIGKKYTKITEFETAIIALAGPLTNLFIALIFQTLALPGFETFIEMNYLMAIYSMIPISQLDGAKIFFGSIFLYIFSIAFIIFSIALLNIIGLIGSLILSSIIAIMLLITYMYKTL